MANTGYVGRGLKFCSCGQAMKVIRLAHSVPRRPRELGSHPDSRRGRWEMRCPRCYGSFETVSS